MNLDKTATSLEKINRLFALIKEMGEGSSTERDLLKAYIGDLYKAVSDGETLEEALPAAPPAPPQQPLRAAIPLQPITPNSITPEPITQEPIPQVPPTLETQETAEPTPLPEAVSVESAPTPRTAKSAASASKRFDDLFDLEAGKELSDRLSSSPIKDLTKAISINEKIFTINELFGGNSDEFNNMLVVINGLNSFEEAKEILINSVAIKYEWDKDGISKKAQKFIKLIDRRFK